MFVAAADGCYPCEAAGRSRWLRALRVGGRLCGLGLSCPRVTLVLPGKLDKRPQGEFALGGQRGGAPGHAWGQQGEGGVSPTHSAEPGSIPRAAVWGARVFSHEQNGCRQQLNSSAHRFSFKKKKKSPLAAAPLPV